MFLWLNLLLSCVISFGFKPIVYDDFRNSNVFTESTEILNCSETKVRDNYMSSGDYFFLLMSDLSTPQFANDLFYNSITNLGTEFNNFPSSIAYPTIEGESIVATIGDAVEGSAFGFFRSLDSNGKIITLSSSYPITEITFRKTFTQTFSDGSTNYQYNITFSSRAGNGLRVDLVRFVYYYVFPLRYTDTIDNLVELGNYCVKVGRQYTNNSPLNQTNILNYVYVETLGGDYPQPLYSSYYRGLNTRVDIDTARQEGYSEGWTSGRNSGYNEGKQVGFSEGVQYAYSQDTTALTIFTGIIDVGLLPVNVFLKMFEFEVFGINIAGALSALLTIAVTFIILRFVTGKKDD